MDSLPTTEYETLFQWSYQEVETYLAGTTLGTMILTDRKEEAMKKRYRLAIRSHLQTLALVAHNEMEDEEFDIFLRACMCISTRGFHLTKEDDCKNPPVTSTDDSKSKNNNYDGPFLLPVIDLLNHDPPNSCTTLQRDATTGMFYMMAERSLAANEAVVHSYGDELTSAQLLQTFGFVSSRSDNKHLTPASLSKTKHLLPACQTTKASDYPRQLQESMKAQQLEDDVKDEVWNVREIPNRSMPDDVSEDLLVSVDELLSDEFITFLCVQFLPMDSYEELCTNDRITALLDRSILEDYYLGKLVCHTLHNAIDNKLKEYTTILLEGMDPSTTQESNGSSALERDQQTLLQLMAKQPQPSGASHRRAIYGLTIRIEEMSCLQALQKEILKITECLDRGHSIETPSPPTKRAKVENAST
jgi:hypothetical protein